jgi:hypothetical protein
LLFSIYILFNFNIAQAISNEIHVRYNDQPFSFKRTTLEDLEVTKVKDLIYQIRPRLKSEKISDKVITLRRGGEVLGPETPASGLYNQSNEALEVVVEGKI